MTRREFREYVNALNNKMRVQNRKIHLIVDNAPGHPKIKTSHVNLHFLPPSTASTLQPLDGGITKQVKSLYRKALVRHIRARLSECATAYELLTTIDLHDAIQWIILHGCKSVMRQLRNVLIIVALPLMEIR